CRGPSGKRGSRRLRRKPSASAVPAPVESARARGTDERRAGPAAAPGPTRGPASRKPSRPACQRSPESLHSRKKRQGFAAAASAPAGPYLMLRCEKRITEGNAAHAGRQPVSRRRRGDRRYNGEKGILFQVSGGFFFHFNEIR